MDAAGLLDNNLTVRILQAGHLTITPAWWRFHYSNDVFWRLYRNGQDGASVTIGGRKIPLHAGWLYLIPSHLSMELSCERPAEHFYVHFDVAGLPEIALRELFTAPFGQPCPLEWEQAIQDVALGLAAAGPGDKAPLGITGQCHIKGMLYAALARHLQTIPAEQIERCWSLAERLGPVLPALHYIEQHLGEDLSNPVLAGACSMSDGHFIRTFRACTKQTPAQYVIECRIRAALRRLLLTSETIDEIADRYGFGSRHYFSRMFTRQTGQPPAAFRRSQRH